MTVCDLTTYAPASAPDAARRRRWLREVALLVLLYAGYSAARLLGGATMASATAHGRDLLAVERLLHVDIEGPANAALAAVPPLAIAASYWYSVLHYIVTPAVLVWAYRRRPGHYPLLRNALVVASAVGLVVFALLPMAPPRMLPGFVDTLASTADVGWWGGDASAPRGLGSLTNQLAAMPSLHVGWAVWVAWVGRLAYRRWVRVLAVAYPVVTTLVVVATANHYLLDAVAGAAVVAFGVHVAGRRATPRARVPSGPADLPAQRAGTHWSSASASSTPERGSVVRSSSCPRGSSSVTSAPRALGGDAPGSTTTTAPEARTGSRWSGRPGLR